MSFGLQLGLSLGSERSVVEAATFNSVDNQGTAMLDDVANYLDFNNSQEGTLILSFKFNVAATAAEYLCAGRFASGTFLRRLASGSMTCTVQDSTNATVIAVAGATDFTTASSNWLNLMFSWDLGTTNGSEIYINNSLYVSATYTAVANTMRTDREIGLLGIDQGSSRADVTVRYTAIYNKRLPGSANWSDFFTGGGDPTNQTGTVSTSTPVFVMYGNAAAWAAGSFNVDNSTPTTTVIDGASFQDV